MKESETMLETFRRVELLDNASDYAEQIRGRNLRLTWILAAFVFVSLSVIWVMQVLAPGVVGYSPLVALAVAVCLALPVVIWNEPRMGLYILTFSACAFFQKEMELSRDVLGTIPFWWNISTAVGFFTHSTSLEFLHLSFAEIVMVITVLSWLIRQIVMRELKIRTGAIFGWFAAYLVWCCFGFYRGLTTGGTLTTALWELRAQAYLALAYLMAANLVTERKHALQILWALTLSIGLNSLFGCITFARNPGVSADEGVLSHEDSQLFNILLFSALVFTIARVEPKLRRTLLTLAPLALIANLANGRRAAIAAMLVAFPAVIAMSAVLLKERRKALISFLVAFCVVMAIYLPVAWNSDGAWALPARAFKSKFSPSGRDASSDYYRLSENNNLKLTRDTSPWLGIGYGKPYIVAFTQYGRYDPFMAILPHNGVLWIWMRLGHVGFVLFWMFVANVLIRGPMLLKKIRDPDLQVYGILAIAVFLMQIIYGEYDLLFAGYRPMWVTGTLLGVMAALPYFAENKEKAPAAVGTKPYREAARDEDSGSDDSDEDAEEVEFTREPKRLLPGGKSRQGWTRDVDW